MSDSYLTLGLVSLVPEWHGLSWPGSVHWNLPFVCCCCSVAKSCRTLFDSMNCSMPGFGVLHISWSLLKLILWGTDAIQLSHLLLPPSFLALSLSQHQGLFHWVGSCIRWPKYWSFNFSISPSIGYPELNSFRIDWLDLLVVQGTLKSFLQHHSSKASILQCSDFIMVPLSHAYMTTGKIIALTIRTFVGKMMSLPFNMLSRFVIAFLPRSKCLLISGQQSLSTVDFGAQESKVCHCFHFFPIYLPWSDGSRCHDLSFLNVEF